MKPFQFEPPPNNNIHSWVMRQARLLQLRGYPQEYARVEFHKAIDAIDKMGLLRRGVPEREIDGSIDKVYATIGEPPKPRPCVYDPVAGWPSTLRTPPIKVDEALIARALSESPVKTLADIPESKGSWHDLFQPDDLLCVGTSQSEFRTVLARDLPSLPDMQYLVPNPLRKRKGRTISGGLSSHCRDAVGPRKYIIMESDTGSSVETQVSVAFWLAAQTEATIKLIVESAGKSSHVWFDTAGTTDSDVAQWFNLAVSLGADPRLILPEQFVRYPNGWRPEKQARQRILYTNS